MEIDIQVMAFKMEEETLSQKCEKLLKAGKNKKTGSHLQPPEENNPVDLFRFLTSRKVRE